MLQGGRSDRFATYVNGRAISAAVAAALFVAAVVAFDHHRVTGSDSASLVNTSGRQRMLSQRIALQSRQLAEGNPADEVSLRHSIMECIDTLERAHQRLCEASARVARVAGDEASPATILFGEEHQLDSLIREYVDTARLLLSSEDPALVDQHSRRLVHLATEPPLLETLDELVTAFELLDARLSREAAFVIGALLLATAGLACTLLILVLPSSGQFRRLRDQAAAARGTLETIIDGAKEYSIITFDTGGRVTSWNGGAMRLFGYEASEAIGVHFSRFFTRQSQTENVPAKELQHVLADQRLEAEGWRVRKDGSRFWANVISSPIHGRDGSVTGFSKVIRDLTERRRLEQRFRTTIDSAPVAIVMADQGGRIVLANKQAGKLFGYDCDELLERSVEILLPESGRPLRNETNAPIADDVDTGLMPFGTTAVGRHKDGHEIAVDTNFSLVTSDDGVYTVVALVDVSEVQQTRQALVESEKRFRAISDCAPVAIWVCDEGSSCIWLNQKWLDYAGDSMDEHLGRGWLRVVHPDDQESARETYEGAFAKREAFTLDYRLRRYDGQYRWHTATGTPRFSEEGVFLGYVGLSFDDHDARINRQELERLNDSLRESSAIHRSLIDQSLNFLGLMRLDGTLIDANRTALTAAGIDEKDVLGVPFWETPWWEHSVELQQRLREAVASVSQGVTDGFEATHLDADGQVIHVDFSLKPVKDEAGNTIYLIPEGRDITYHKQREAELSDLLEAVEKSNKELEQFAYVASHDLQEPLRKIDAYGQLLQEEQGHLLNEDGQHYLEVVRNGAKRLQKLVRDLLSFSRITTRGNPIESCRASECLSEAISNLELVIKESNASVTFDSLPSVLADHSQLVHLFQNLVGNAIKYRGEADPEIHIGGAFRGQAFEFSVQDNGIGIDEQYFDRIFMIFQRLHNRREYSGTGIGLALCKRIVERFGGTICVTSKVGQGSTFLFTIPLSPGSIESDDGARDTFLEQEPVCVH